MTAGFPTRIAFVEACAIIDAVAFRRRLPFERRSLSRVQGQILGQDLVASLPQPPFDNAAMDGFALRHADLGAENVVLKLVGEQFAGPADALRVGPGQCVRITTGAPLVPRCVRASVRK